MRAMVMDGSIALGFLMADEQAPQARRALEAMDHGVPVVVPSHWALEVANGLLVAERRKRISRAGVAEAIGVLGQLPLDTDDQSARRAWAETSALARQHGLSIYDAAYLELALRRGAALATSDEALARAAKRARVEIV